MSNVVELQIKATGAAAAKEAVRGVTAAVNQAQQAGQVGQAAASSALETAASKLKSWGVVASDADDKGRRFVSGVARFAGFGQYAEQIGAMSQKFSSLTGAITTSVGALAAFGAGWKIGSMIDDVTGLSTAFGNLMSGPALKKYDRAEQLKMERQAFENEYNSRSSIDKLMGPEKNGWGGSDASFDSNLNGKDAEWAKREAQAKRRWEYEDRIAEIKRLSKDRSATEIVDERMAKGLVELPKDVNAAAAAYKELIRVEQEALDLPKKEAAASAAQNQTSAKWEAGRAAAVEEASDRSKRATLDEFDYRQAKLDEWRDAQILAYGQSTGAQAAWAAESAQIDKDRTAAVEAEIDKRLEAEFAEVDGYGQVLAKERDQARAHQAAMDEINRRLSQPGAGRFELRRADTDAEYNQRLNAINEKVSLGRMSAEEAAGETSGWLKVHNQEFDQIGREQSNNFSAGWKEGMDKWQVEVESGFEAARSLARDTAQAMSSSFSDFFFDSMTGKLQSLSDYMNSFFTSVARSMSNMMGDAVTKQIVGGIGSMFGSATGNVGADGFTHRASGGPVYPGQAYMVGENGPELFLPQGAGNIVPNGGSGSGAAAAVMPAVKVVVVNNTGTQANVRQDEPKFDGQEYVVTVWLDAYTRNAMGLRSALGGASR